MDFKPTLWKSVVSVLVFIVADYILSLPKACLEFAGGPERCYPLIGSSLDIKTIFFSILTGLIIYIIWSLFQKKN
ncbi:MAG: hypothetical protein AABX48_00395 [Nanoarchaeota archaeon]